MKAADRLRLAVVQQPSVMFDRERAVQTAADHVQDAADRGAELVVFPETWVGGYPAWCFGLAAWDDPAGKHWYGRFVESSPVVRLGDEQDDLGPLRSVAADRGVHVMIGLNERPGPGSGTLFNSLVSIDERGLVSNVHRKLTPTHAEKLVWAPGDAAGLRVHPVAAARVGGLICWENLNPLARQVLHSQDEQIHVGSWPDAPVQHQLATRSYALEGRCYSVLAASLVRRRDVPPELHQAYLSGLGATEESTDPDSLLLDGGSAVAGPDGRWVVEPVPAEATTIVVDLDLSRLVEEKLAMDLGGHYQRPDVFRLTVNATRPSLLDWTQDPA